MLLHRPILALTAAVVSVPLSLAVHSPAIAGEFAIEDVVLGHMGRDTHKAVQEALRTKGYYQGPIDGAFGAKSRAAVLKFRADNGIARPGRAALKLDAPLVEALFGVNGLSVNSWESQACLLNKLGKISDAEAAGACDELQ